MTPIRGVARIVGMFVVTRGVVRSIPATPILFALPAMLGSIRGVTVGLMVGTREPMLRLGVRMMLCAYARETSRPANSDAAVVNSNASRRVFIRQLARSSSMCPRIARYRAVRL
jgi:hypothetical protein